LNFIKKLTTPKVELEVKLEKMWIKAGEEISGEIIIKPHEKFTAKMITITLKKHEKQKIVYGYDEFGGELFTEKWKEKQKAKQIEKLKRKEEEFNINTTRKIFFKIPTPQTIKPSKLWKRRYTLTITIHIENRRNLTREIEVKINPRN